MTLNEWRDKCHQASVESGWWPKERLHDPEMHGLKIALIHSEVSEMLEGIRTGQMDKHITHRRTIEVEAADILIRLFDLAGALELDLEGAIIEKLSYNKHRLDHKRSVRRAVGGKRF